MLRLAIPVRPLLVALAVVVLQVGPARAWRIYAIESANGSPSLGGYGPSLHFDTIGRPLVAWWNPFAAIRFSEYDGTSWQSVVPFNLACPAPGSAAGTVAAFSTNNARPWLDHSSRVDFLHSWWSSLALDPSGQPSIAYAMQDANDIASQPVAWAVRTPSCWGFERVTEMSSMYPSLAIGSDGVAQVLFGGLVVHGVHTPTGWQLDTLEAGTGTEGGAPSLALDANNRPHAAYQTASGLVVSDRIGGVWQRSPLGVDGINPSLAIDAQGLAHLAYRSVGTVYYGERDARGAWSIVGVDKCASYPYAEMPSLALDATGEPYIAYVSADEAHLMVASRAGASWSTQSVTGLSGAYANHMDVSLAVRRDGLIAVAYVSDVSQPSLYLATSALITLDVPAPPRPTRLALRAWPRPLTAGGALHLSAMLPHSGEVHIALYDALGRRVASLEPRWADAGLLTLDWNVPDLAPGVYRLRLRVAGEIVESRVVRL